MRNFHALGFALAAAAATVVAAQPPPPPPGASVVTRPDWLKKPSGDDLASAWPLAGRGRNGSARIRCQVNAQGLLYGCKVVSEDPPGLGFGASALLLAPNFQMRPRTMNGKPVDGASVSIPISFKGVGKDNPYSQRINVIPTPAWRQAPSTAEVAAAYPKGQKEAGHLVFRCGLNDGYTVRDCELLSGQGGFEPAARGLLKKFHLQLPEVGRRDREKLRVILPVHMGGAMASTAGAQRIMAPQWSRVLDPARIQRLFPEKAAAAAVIVVDALAIFPWTTDGLPVDGARITVPVQFSLAQTDIPASTAPAPPR